MLTIYTNCPDVILSVCMSWQLFEFIGDAVYFTVLVVDSGDI